MKVNQPERFNFEPRTLLTNILTMYANMSNEEVFLKNVVNDARSYKDETFEKAVRIINNTKKGITLDADRKEKFEMMVVNLKSMRLQLAEEEVILTKLKRVEFV